MHAAFVSACRRSDLTDRDPKITTTEAGKKKKQRARSRVSGLNLIHAEIEFAGWTGRADIYLRFIHSFL